MLELVILFGFFVAATLICTLLVWAIPSLFRRRSRTGKELRFSIATIARDLIRVLKNHDLNGSTITIVGYNCKYLLDGKKGPVLEDCLLEWAERGAKIRYVILAPDEYVCKKFAELIEMIKPLRGDLEVYLFDNNDADSGAKLAALRFRTHHPTTIRFANKSCAFWVEYDHPVNAVYAKKAKFVPPQQIGKRGNLKEFEYYESEIEKIVQSCSRVPLSGGRESKAKAA